jgi:hypothetical protein
VDDEGRGAAGMGDRERLAGIRLGDGELRREGGLVREIRPIGRIGPIRPISLESSLVF